MESRKRTPNVKGDIKKKISRAPNREQVMSELKQGNLYDSKEACELLRISLQSLRRAIAIGKIKTVRLGRRYLRIPATEIERLTKGEEVALLSVKETAELLNVSAHMIRALIKAGKISAFRLADTGPYKIPKSEIDRIFREGISQ